MPENERERSQRDGTPAAEEPKFELYDPFETLFRVRPQAPGEYRRTKDGRDF